MGLAIAFMPAERCNRNEMELLAEIVRFALDFIVGTVVLWLCSMTTSTPNANLKTAAIYNAIMVVVGIVVFGFVILFLATGMGAGLFLLIILMTLILLLVLLMWLYEISFLASLWLAIAMIAVSVLVERATAAIF